MANFFLGVLYLLQVHSFYEQVEPLLSGHSRGNGRWLLNGGWLLNKRWCTLNIFHHQVNFFVNMVSLQDNHDKCMLELFLSLLTSYFGLLSAITFSKTKFLNFGWPFNSDKDNRKTLIGTTKRWLWLLYNGGWCNRGFTYSTLLTTIFWL